MTTTALESYSDNELALHVFNTEYLYRLVPSRLALLATVEQDFTYTSTQFGVLNDWLDDDDAEREGT